MKYSIAGSGYSHRAYFTSWMGAYPLIKALRHRRNDCYQGHYLPDGSGYIVMW